MADDSRYLFVYGTLMSGARGALGTQQRLRLARESDSLGPASLHFARLYDLGRYPGVKDVGVVGVPHEKWGEAVHAVIVLHEDASATAAEVLEWCRDKMAGYKRPRSISFMTETEMPRTATGKILHRVLRDRLTAALTNAK